MLTWRMFRPSIVEAETDGHAAMLGPWGFIDDATCYM